MSRILRYTVLLLGCLVIAFPVYLTIVTAMKTPQESAHNFFALPSSFYLDNFVTVITKAHYFRYFLNSLVVTVVSVSVEMIALPLFAFVLARNMNRPYYRILYVLTILGIFVPFQVVMLPTVKLLHRIGMLSTLGLILLYLTYTLKKGVFLFVGYIKSIPLELEESAFVDGSTIFQSYRSIIYPLMRPMIATMVIIDGLWIWNDFLLPLLILNRNTASWTLPLFQFRFKNQYSFDFTLAFASFLLSMLPILILYVFMQKHIISGMTRGAIKG